MNSNKQCPPKIDERPARQIAISSKTLLLVIGILVVLLIISLLALFILKPISNKPSISTPIQKDSAIAEKDANATKAYWKKLDELQTGFKNHLHEIQDREYPLAQGVYDFRSFSDLDFETLRDNDFKRADVYENYAGEISKLPVLDVDSLALKYALAVSNYCRKEAKHGQHRGQLVSRIHQHKTKFTSVEGYTVRVAETISGGSEINNLEKVDQAEIDKLGAELKVYMQDAENGRSEVNQLLQGTKIELTSKYKSEFD